MTQQELDKYGIKLITQKDAPGRVFAYTPSNNAIGLGGPDQVHEILDPNSIQGFSYTDLDTLPKKQTGNVQQNFLYGKAGGENMSWADFQNKIVGNYAKNTSIKESQDLALKQSNEKLGAGAFTGKESDFVKGQPQGPIDPNTGKPTWNYVTPQQTQPTTGIPDTGIAPPNFSQPQAPQTQDAFYTSLASQVTTPPTKLES